MLGRDHDSHHDYRYYFFNPVIFIVSVRIFELNQCNVLSGKMLQMMNKTINAKLCYAYFYDVQVGWSTLNLGN